MEFFTRFERDFLGMSTLHLTLIKGRIFLKISVESYGPRPSLVLHEFSGVEVCWLLKMRKSVKPSWAPQTKQKKTQIIKVNGEKMCTNWNCRHFATSPRDWLQVLMVVGCRVLARSAGVWFADLNTIAERRKQEFKQLLHCGKIFEIIATIQVHLSLYLIVGKYLLAFVIDGAHGKKYSKSWLLIVIDW